ncbi:MAG: hypothetical protein JXA09_14620 [Anaerolineae bacterium]|nr:hypothetical protein [Anaerolineae bacterium]
MSRVIATDSVGKRRNQLRRTIAEALRRLATKSTFDAESQDLAALIVFSLRRLEEGVDQTASAWEKRDYYLKADRFRLEWEWIEETTYALESALLLGQWDKVPQMLAALFPRFADITISRYTRSSELWDGAYQRLVGGK